MKDHRIQTILKLQRKGEIIFDLKFINFCILFYMLASLNIHIYNKILKINLQPYPVEPLTFLVD